MKDNQNVQYMIISTLLILLNFFCLSCKKESIHDNTFYVSIVYPTDGLGDQGFVDNIFRGIITSQYKHGFTLYHYFPKDNDESVFIIDSLINSDNDKKMFLILADGTYGSILDKYPHDLDQHKILLLDGFSAKNVGCIEFSFYGAAFMAGKIAAKIGKHDTADFIAGMPLPSLIGCYNGFKDGFISGGGKSVQAFYLDSTTRGFGMISEAENLVNQQLSSRDIVFGAAGGANVGIFNAIREKENVYAIGVDSDQSNFALGLVIGSVTKSIDLVIEQVMDDYVSGKYNHPKIIYTLESGYMDFVLSPVFKEKLSGSLESIRNEAIEKEKNYLIHNAN